MSATAWIVMEGVSRLQWAGAGGTWQLLGIWPGPGEQLKLIDHLAAGLPLLVVLDSAGASVPVWRSELAQTPMASALMAEVHTDEELIDIAVPFLDWLPEALRRRGRMFSEQARQLIGCTPSALLAPLIVEDEPAQDAQVRFVQRTGGRAPTRAELSQLASRLLNTENTAVLL